MKGSYIGKPAGGKLLRVDLEWDDGVVKKLSIRGDFFAHPEERFDEAEAAMVGAPVDGLAAALDAVLRKAGVTLYGLSASDIGVAVDVIMAGQAVQP